MSEKTIIDVCTYNGEKDIWDIHYNVLKDHVDEFVVVEFDRTFSGEIKPPTFPVVEYPQVHYYYIGEEVYEKYREMAYLSPQTQGADHWKREFMQKESIKDTLTSLLDTDIVCIGDVDEIWKPSALKLAFPVKLKLDVYTYYLNNKSSEQFWGTIIANYETIKNTCLNHLRTNAPKTKKSYGWHFTSMGGVSALKQKLENSYTQDSYATPQVLQNLEYNIQSNQDFLGRDFTYEIDEKNWPLYLKEHKGDYKHLCRE